MFIMSNWYTDLMSVYRVVEVTEDGLTRQKRVQIAQGVPCRVYSSQVNNLSVRDTAAVVRASEKLACGVDVDVMAGDELMVTRGGNLPGRRYTRTSVDSIFKHAVRYLAGEPQDFYDPVGGALTGLEHKEVGLLRENIAR